MRIDRSRWKAFALAAALAIGLGPPGCRRDEPREDREQAPGRATTRPRRRSAVRRAGAATAPKPSASDRGGGPASAPAPWERVRPSSPAESYAFFRKLNKVATVRVPLVKPAPKVDGEADAAYEQATPLGLRYLDGRAGRPKATTTVRAVSTPDELFVLFDCRSPDMSALRAGVKDRDGEVWRDDSVELFLDVANDRRRNSYYHIIINSLGTTAESDRARPKEPEKWDPALRVKTKVGDAGWSVEVALPFADLVADGRSFNRVWAANFNRMAYLPGGTEDTAWCPTGGTSSHNPSYFGLLWLDAGGVYADYSRWDGPRHVYQRPARPLFQFKPIAPRLLAECGGLTPNADRTRWFGTAGKGSEVLRVLTEQRAVEVSSLHGWRPIEARWLNAKLIYIYRTADEHSGYYCIYDAAAGEVLVEETERDGADVWRRISRRVKPAD